MSAFYEMLDDLRKRAGTQAEKGAMFERVIKTALERHPGEYGSARFKGVWRWNAWPERTECGFEGDIGIDLVADQTDAFGGGRCAIQCKFYAAGNKVPSKDIDKFLAAAGGDFRSRILVITGDLTGPSWKKIQKANPVCHVITDAELASWPVNWGPGLLDNHDCVTFSPERYRPHPFQAEAVQAVAEGFEDHDRGKLILPCGTGKSVVALWVAETVAGKGRRVLYVVPSIALMGQTMREWARQRNPDIPHRYVGVCSDTKAGRASEDSDLVELAMPVTTDPDRISEQLQERVSDKMTVVFSTYQSLPLIAAAPHHFDLVICDEAHRTTGLQEKNKTTGFRLIHDRGAIVADKGLFMTATPRFFTDKARTKAGELARKKRTDLGLYSMDDPDLYGPEFYRMDFAEAVEGQFLTDYRVVVIAVDETKVADLRGQIDTDLGRLKTRELVKLVGCWDALADPTTRTTSRRVTGAINPDHAARRAIAFNNTIATSKGIEKYWERIIDGARDAFEPGQMGAERLKCSVKHVDGKMNAYQKASAVDWLQNHVGGGCRVVTNAKVFTEGVDVPALDAILFINPKRSQVEVVQAVGRVMRRSKGKEFGYVVIPVVVPEGSSLTDEDVLNGSDFKQVWSVLKALRSHDGRADVWVNTADLGTDYPVTVTMLGDLCQRCGTRDCDESCLVQPGLPFPFPLREAIASKLVEKCGDRQYWPQWAEQVAGIAKRIQRLVDDALLDVPELRHAFDRFLADLKATVGGHITKPALVEMVSHHVVTLPVFDALFSESGFSDRNPISKALNELIGVFKTHQVYLTDETVDLDRFYQSVAQRVATSSDPTARLRVMLDVYESFFKKAMPRQVQQLGVAYTPVELVDFMVRSVDAVCRQEFGMGVTGDGVHVLDPFTGTGTFINRILTEKTATGDWLIEDADLLRKFTGEGNVERVPELHANEILLLAYYLAAIKIEEGHQQRTGGYQPFEGIVLTDTFELGKGTGRFPQTQELFYNSRRAETQSRLPIKVIIGNPPWRSGQKSAGDDNPSMDRPDLEQRIRDTYGRRHKEITGRGAGGNAAGNQYVQAFRWASDRLNGGGVLAFIHPNSLATGTSLAGMRAAFRDEFTHIYVVNLRGDAYKSGDERQKEGDPAFGQGTRNGVQITVLVRNPEKALAEPAALHYAEVPEYSTLEQKFAWLADLGDVTSDQFQVVPVNNRHDWVNLTDGTFEQLLPVCSTKASQEAAVLAHARGVGTSCDVYVYSYSRQGLVDKVKALIEAYEDARFFVGEGDITFEDATQNTELGVIKWTATLKNSLKADKEVAFDESCIREVLYRPFTKLWLYEDDRILGSVKTVSKMFPRNDREGVAVSGGATQESSTGGGADQRYLSPQDRTPPYSRLSLPTESRTSREEESPKLAGSLRGGDPDLGDLQHDVSGAGIDHPTRPGGDQGITADTGDAAASEELDPGGGVGDPGQPHPTTSLRDHRRQSTVRSVRHGTTDPQPSQAKAILIIRDQQLPFSTMVTEKMTDLHVTGRPTRVLPRQRS